VVTDIKSLCPGRVVETADVCSMYRIQAEGASVACSTGRLMDAAIGAAGSCLFVGPVEC
jgi:hypothetical protein